MQKLFKNIKVLMRVCDQMGIPYTRPGGNVNFVEVRTPSPHIFFKCRVPFNNDTFNVLCKKKNLTYSLLQSAVTIPHTKTLYDDRSGKIADFTKSVVDECTFPVVMKTNIGLMGKGVFLCKDAEQVSTALSYLFSADNPHYDGIVLAQAYVPHSAEYRVIVFMNKVMFAYKKTYEGPKFSGENGSAYHKKEIPVMVSDAETLRDITAFIETLTKAVPLEFSGVDLVKNDAGELVLLELNTHPGFTDFIRECGTKQIETLYETMLQFLLKRG